MVTMSTGDHLELGKPLYTWNISYTTDIDNNGTKRVNKKIE